MSPLHTPVSLSLLECSCPLFTPRSLSPYLSVHVPSLHLSLSLSLLECSCILFTPRSLSPYLNVHVPSLHLSLSLSLLECSCPLFTPRSLSPYLSVHVPSLHLSLSLLTSVFMSSSHHGLSVCLCVCPSLPPPPPPPPRLSVCLSISAARTLLHTHTHARTHARTHAHTHTHTHTHTHRSVSDINVILILLRTLFSLRGQIVSIINLSETVHVSGMADIVAVHLTSFNHIANPWVYLLFRRRLVRIISTIPRTVSTLQTISTVSIKMRSLVSECSHWFDTASMISGVNLILMCTHLLFIGMNYTVCESCL